MQHSTALEPNINFDYADLDALRRQHPAWRLLAAEHAPLIASFLHRAFIVPNVRVMAQADLAEALEDTLFGLRQQLHEQRSERLGEQVFPRSAQDYLNDWTANDKGWLRKFYPGGSDEPHFDLTPATERALAWLGSLGTRAFVGTESRDKRARTGQKTSDAEALRKQTLMLAEPDVPDMLDARGQPARVKRLADLQLQALGAHTLTVESCDNRERDMRDWLRKTIDADDARIKRLRDRIIDAMRSFSTRYPLETREVDVSVEAAGDYRALLDKPAADDLPRFEARFKELVNENTIRELAHFNSQLRRSAKPSRNALPASTSR